MYFKITLCMSNILSDFSKQIWFLECCIFFLSLCFPSHELLVAYSLYFIYYSNLLVKTSCIVEKITSLIHIKTLVVTFWARGGNLCDGRFFLMGLSWIGVDLNREVSNELYDYFVFTFSTHVDLGLGTWAIISVYMWGDEARLLIYTKKTNKYFSSRIHWGRLANTCLDLFIKTCGLVFGYLEGYLRIWDGKYWKKLEEVYCGCKCVWSQQVY